MSIEDKQITSQFSRLLIHEKGCDTKMKITPIKLRRINAGFESEDAWEALGISNSTFYKLEQGHMQPGAKLIKRMANVYKCTTDEIFKDFNIKG